MQKRCMLISLALVSFFCTGFKLNDINYKFTKEYQTSSGAVTFDHEAHASGRDKDCVNCHSALETFGGEISELLAHNYCKACHEMKNGPTDCMGCHAQKTFTLKKASSKRILSSAGPVTKSQKLGEVRSTQI